MVAFSGKIGRIATSRKKDKTEKARGVGGGTRGEVEKWNQMTALERQKESIRKCL